MPTSTNTKYVCTYMHISDKKYNLFYSSIFVYLVNKMHYLYCICLQSYVQLFSTCCCHFCRRGILQALAGEVQATAQPSLGLSQAEGRWHGAGRHQRTQRGVVAQPNEVSGGLFPHLLWCIWASRCAHTLPFMKKFTAFVHVLFLHYVHT